MRTLPLSGALLLTLALPLVALATPPAMEPLAELKLEPYQAGLHTVTAVVGGKPRRMLFDTGGGLTIISPAVAAEIGCTPSGQVVGFRQSGEKVVTQRCPGRPVTLGGVELPQEELAVFDLGKMLPPSWPKLDGMVSLKTLESVPFTLDLGRGRLVLESAQTLPRCVARRGPLKARLARLAGGAALDVLVAVKGGPMDLWFLLDTGNVTPTLIAPHALEALGRLVPATRGGHPPVVSDVPLQLVGQSAPQASTVMVKDIIYDGNLGAEFMKGWLFTMDLREGKVWGLPKSAVK